MVEEGRGNAGMFEGKGLKKEEIMEWRAGKSKIIIKSLIDPMYSKSAFVTEI